MKKRKFSIWLNVVTICLSICAIAIGVYSIKTATLNINGTIGFTAHNCKVNISAYMYGHSLTADGTPVAKPTSDSEKQYLVYGTSNTKATESAPLVINGGSESLSFNINTDSTYKGIYFSDNGTSGEAEPITIVLTITNLSGFEVLVDGYVEAPTDAKYTILCYDVFNVLYAEDSDTKSTKITASYVLYPKLDANGNFENIVNPANVSLAINFSKIDTNISKDGFVIETDTGFNNLSAIKEVPASNGSDILVIPSQFTDGTQVGQMGFFGSSQAVTNINTYSKIVILNEGIFLAPYAFRGEEIKLIYVPKTRSVAYAPFGGCKGLKNVTNSGLCSQVFTGCTSLTSAIIPEGTTDMGNYDDAFSYCTSLIAITIPASVTNIKLTPFYNCTNLKIVKFENPNGWHYSSPDNVDGINFSTSDMSNRKTAAEILIRYSDNHGLHRT